MGSEKKTQWSGMFSDSSGVDMRSRPGQDLQHKPVRDDAITVRQLLDDSFVAPRYELQHTRKNVPSLSWKVTTLGEIAKILMG